MRVALRIETSKAFGRGVLRSIGHWQRKHEPRRVYADERGFNEAVPRDLSGGADFPEGFRAGFEVRGFRMGASRQPASDTHRAGRSRLANRVRDFLHTHGITTP